MSDQGQPATGAANNNHDNSQETGMNRELTLVRHDKFEGANVLTAVNSQNRETTQTREGDIEKATASAEANSKNNDSNIVFWEGPDDPENPMNWSSKLKIINIALVSTWTFLTPLASSMVAPGILNILTDFNSISATLGSFIVSIFVLGYAVGPLGIAPLSEIYGRLPIYHVCNILFIIWSLACAFAPNLGALLAFRFFQGVAGVCPLTIGSGTISDLIPTEQRGKFMAIYSLGFVHLLLF